VWLTSELFRFVETPTGVSLQVGTRQCPVGELLYIAHRKHDIPASIRIAVHAGRWYVSFSFDDGEPEYEDAEIACWLQSFSREKLSASTIGLDRGTAIPIAASGNRNFDFRAVEKKRLRRKERAIRHWQRKLARRQKDSKRRLKAKQRIAAYKRYQVDLRRDFAHQTSRKLVDDPQALLFVFEDLHIRNMTASARGTAEEPGQRVRQKAGLNRSILASVWGQTETNLAYKARRAHKLSIEAPPFRSSQECRVCGYTHKDNRISQSEFVCQACGHTEIADTNASHVIGNRGVDLILSGAWKPKEKKRVKITASKMRTGDWPISGGDPVGQHGSSGHSAKGFRSQWLFLRLRDARADIGEIIEME
jgi:putative transposase